MQNMWQDSNISKSRPYPQPSLIHNFLRENTDFSGEIGTNDRACYTCYKSHLVTIKHINHTAQSIKQDLGTLLTKIKESYQTFEIYSQLIVSYHTLAT